MHRQSLSHSEITFAIDLFRLACFYCAFLQCWEELFFFLGLILFISLSLLLLTLSSLFSLCFICVFSSLLCFSCGKKNIFFSPFFCSHFPSCRKKFFFVQSNSPFGVCFSSSPGKCSVSLGRKKDWKKLSFSESIFWEQDRLRSTVVGTPYWTAPEVFEFRLRDYCNDIWAVGVLVREMTDGEPPWMEFPPLRAMWLSLTKDVPFLGNSSVPLCDFSRKLLEKDYRKRQSASELLGNEFLACSCTPREILLLIERWDRVFRSQMDNILVRAQANWIMTHKAQAKYRNRKVNMYSGKWNVRNVQRERSNNEIAKIFKIKLVVI